MQGRMNGRSVAARGKKMRQGLIIAVVLLGSSLGFAQDATPPAQNAAPAPVPAVAAKNDYSNGANWLCRPGREDACGTDLATTVISADGKLGRETFAANPNAPIDCF